MVTELRQTVNVDKNKSHYWKFAVISTSEITYEEDMDHTEMAAVMAMSVAEVEETDCFEIHPNIPYAKRDVFPRIEESCFRLFC